MESSFRSSQIHVTRAPGEKRGNGKSLKTQEKKISLAEEKP